MTQSNTRVEIKAAASFSDVLENESWSAVIKKAADADSVAFVEPSEQPSPASSPRPSSSRRYGG